MTEQNENTNEKGTNASDLAPDTMKAAMQCCGCDCATMMTRFFQDHPDNGVENEKTLKNGCC
jgi:hypothetical protein